MADSIGWLKDVLGDVADDGTRESVFRRHITGDTAEICLPIVPLGT